MRLCVEWESFEDRLDEVPRVLRNCATCAHDGRCEVPCGGLRWTPDEDEPEGEE